jgi:hypothetical protein
VTSRKNTPATLIVDDETIQLPEVKDLLFLPRVDGSLKGSPREGYGLIPRNYVEFPEAMFASPAETSVIPESEWDARFDEQEATSSSLGHLRDTMGPNGGHIPSLDQDGQGYCWMYGAVMSVMLLRAAANMPYVRLSAHSAACRVKNFRDEGGWCGLGAQHLRDYGVNTVEEWPEKSMSRANDTPESREKAKQFRVIEDVFDLTRRVFDQQLTRLQQATALFTNQPVQMDFNWMGHSMASLRWVRVERGSWGPEMLNSWTDAWGNRGRVIFRGERGIANGAVAYRVSGRAA